MRTSDAHLEKALEEYNQKVNDLEDEGTPQELLDAYLNRGRVLSMMGSDISAIEDFDEAIGIITELEDSGHTVDTGYFAQAYFSRGELQNDSTGKNMADDYRMVASKLDALVPGSRFFDEEKIIDLCITCAGDLIDAEFFTDALPFTDKGLSLVAGKDDKESRNAFVRLCNLAGQAYMNDEQNEKAYEFFSDAVSMGKELYRTGVLQDEMELVYAYVSKGDMDEFFDKDKEFFEDREAAIDLMEDLKTFGSLDDEELLSNLHGETAQAYMKKGEVDKAEKHLLKQVSYSLTGSTNYMEENDLKKD